MFSRNDLFRFLLFYYDSFFEHPKTTVHF